MGDDRNIQNGGKLSKLNPQEFNVSLPLMKCNLRTSHERVPSAPSKHFPVQFHLGFV
jgi:hypothetical protein